jgi:hypothetical protein
VIGLKEQSRIKRRDSEMMSACQPPLIEQPAADRIPRNVNICMGLFSLIIPTRGRIDGLRRLLDSLRDNAQDPASLEVIVVADEDDRESQSFTYAGPRLERVVAPPGSDHGKPEPCRVPGGFRTLPHAAQRRGCAYLQLGHARAADL